DHSGADPAADPRHSERVRPGSDLHHSRPWAGGAHCRPGCSDVRRADRRNRPGDRAVRKPATSLYARPAGEHTDSRTHPARPAVGVDSGSGAQSGGRATWLCIPQPLPTGSRSLRRRRPAGSQPQSHDPLPVRHGERRARVVPRGHYLMTRQALNISVKKDIALELCDIRREFSISRGFFKPNATLKAVDGVSLRLMRGETLGLVGESGCGKSTLAKMLLGLLAPSSGDVLVNGKHLAGTDRKEMARRIQPIFQDPYSSLNPRKTLREIVTLPLIVHDIGTNAERRQRVESMMDVVGLPKRVIDSYPSQLSGGQRQR
ncbi:Peptide ABC transporter ATP-binding protein, partial [Pseudomonas coronafaciens pv. garcae]